MRNADDILEIGGRRLRSRIFLGTGKFGDDSLIPRVVESSGAAIVTVALRRADPEAQTDNVLRHIPADVVLMPNTSGARNADEAVRIARLSKSMGMSTWIKIEVISDTRYLLPDNVETVRATQILAAEGFTVMPYMNPDLMTARHLKEAGAASVMPLGAPIGTNQGLNNREMIRILIEEIDLPVVVDAGLGRPSQACEVMEMGAAACLVNTAVAGAEDPVSMARAFGEAVAAGRTAFLSGPDAVRDSAEASSPLTGFLDQK